MVCTLISVHWQQAASKFSALRRFKLIWTDWDKCADQYSNYIFYFIVHIYIYNMCVCVCVCDISFAALPPVYGKAAKEMTAQPGKVSGTPEKSLGWVCVWYLCCCFTASLCRKVAKEMTAQPGKVSGTPEKSFGWESWNFKWRFFFIVWISFSLMVSSSLFGLDICRIWRLWAFDVWSHKNQPP